MTIGHRLEEAIDRTRKGDFSRHGLARALAEGKVAAAGLEVLPAEPIIREEAELLRSVYERLHDLSTLLADEILVRMRNVIVTPHSAFNTGRSLSDEKEACRATTIGLSSERRSLSAPK